MCNPSATDWLSLEAQVHKESIGSSVLCWTEQVGMAIGLANRSKATVAKRNAKSRWKV